jgi:nucleotide-binding universal stress UspA family protein
MATSEESVIIPVRLDTPPEPHVGAHDDDADSPYLDTSIVESLAPTQVILLGYWPVPDQSSPQQLRDQFENEARESLEGVRKSLENRGFEVTSELSFTKDRDHLIDRVANKHSCKSVLSPGVVGSDPPDSVLVLLKSDSDLDRIVSTLGTLFGHSDVDILLFHALERQDDVEATEYMLNGVADRLEAQGIRPDRIRWEQSERGSRVETIVSEAANHDLIVLSESEPTVRERIFGPVQSAVSDRTERPSLTIRAGM